MSPHRRRYHMTPNLWFATALATALALAVWRTYPDEFIAAVPYVLLLACPLMHMGHSHRRRQRGKSDDPEPGSAHRLPGDGKQG